MGTLGIPMGTLGIPMGTPGIKHEIFELMRFLILLGFKNNYFYELLMFYFVFFEKTEFLVPTNYKTKPENGFCE